MTCATAILAVFVPLAGLPTLHIGLDGAASLLALGALGSGVAFAINYSIVRQKGIAVASTVTYLIPVFSTAIGAIVLGEPLHWNQLAGTVVLLVGIALSQGRLRVPVIRPRRAPGSVPEAP
jgi:drug/metabolite transporter (DMT)-like permease